MSAQRLLIYYFSGTGNAFRAAQWVAEALPGMESQVLPVDRARPEDLTHLTPKTWLGLFYSVHGFILPWSILKFLWKLPPAPVPGIEVLLLNTRAGFKLRDTFIPGFSGTALGWAYLFLWLKGYQVIGTLPVDMPSSWLAVHPPLGKESVRSLVEHCRERVQTWVQALGAGKRVYHGWWEIPIGVVLLPVSLLYLFYGRFLLSKSFSFNPDCNGCGQCATHCPSHGIRMVDDRPYWTFHCESCMRCLCFCPRQAIEVPHGFVLLLVLVLGFFPYSVWFAHRLNLALGLSFLTPLIQYGLYFLVMTTLYAFFFLLMRLPWFNRLSRRLSLTHYYGRYRAPGVNYRNLAHKE